MKVIKHCNSLKPNGHYALATIHNDLVFISGILPFDNETGRFIEGSPSVQAETIFKNLDIILKKAGSEKNKVLKTTVYIPDITLWDEINAVYQRYFEDHTPARCIVPTNALHFNSNLEMEAIAYI